MTIPWESNVKATGTLTVYDGLKSGRWVHLFKSALQLFNGLRLPVKMTAATDERSANVSMRVSVGTASYDYGGTTSSSSFDPKRLHGYTMLLHVAGGPLEKAVVFLPSDPQYDAGFIRGRQMFEKANLDMMKVIAVHELIHACGLENSDHADDGVFAKNITPQGAKVVAWGQTTPMPPLFLAPGTTTKIANLW